MNSPTSRPTSNRCKLGFLALCLSLSISQVHASPKTKHEDTTTEEAATFTEFVPFNQISIQPLQTPLKEEHFQTLLVVKALQKLGFNVKPTKTVSYEQAHEMIAKGEGTFLAAHWDPLHRDFYQKYGGDKVFWRTNNYITNALQGYLIDKDTAKRYRIHNVEQLADPAIAKLFDYNNDGKADLIGCNRGWGCDSVITHHMQVYNLNDSVNVIRGDYNQLMKTTVQRFKEHKPILFYTWTPNWVVHELHPGKDVVWLQVPFMSLPSDELVKRKSPKGISHGFPTNSIRILANKKFVHQHPALLHLFHSMRLTVKEVSEQNKELLEGKASPADIDAFTDNWINEHRRIFTSWINHANKHSRDRNSMH